MKYIHFLMQKPKQQTVALATAATATTATVIEQTKSKKRNSKKPATVDVVATVDEPVAAAVAATVDVVAATVAEPIVPKKKRVNKPKKDEPTMTIQTTDALPVADAAVAVAVAVAHKKRGRKPKGGKVIQQLAHASASINDAPNIILHLKCIASDIPDLTLTDASTKPGDVVSFNTLETKGADLNESYDAAGVGNFIIGGTACNSKKPRPAPESLVATNSYNHLNDGDYDDDDYDDDDANNHNNPNNNNLKDIWKKLNHLKMCFHKSDVFQNVGTSTRRSCCFWDTCEFDTPPIYVPKCIAANGGYSVYGCFCSPECALAYLMNENVDTSVKFERCQLLNSMYGRVFNYEKSIKPAPNPQYILNKFYGNLSIQEYRKLFKGEQIIYVVNKPLTHILPEMYEDNNEFLLNNKIIPNNTYKLKKKTSAFG